MNRCIFIIYRLWGGGAEKQMLHMAHVLAKGRTPVEVWSLSKWGHKPSIEKLIENARQAGAKIDKCETLSLIRFGVILWWLLKLKSKTVVWTWGLRDDIYAKLARMFNSNIQLLCSLRSFRGESMKCNGYLDQ